ncbi:MAG: M2 family metallopeptidase [Planctomycetaceae bacterium]|jgi:peptidyl-dipeptidase A|nr:M2 family metallopeptidase [Planctomycetaceae bacterium]
MRVMIRICLILCLPVIFAFVFAPVVQAQIFGRRPFDPQTGIQKTNKKMNDDGKKLKTILDNYQKDALKLFKASTSAEWEAMTTGKEEAFAKSAAAKLSYAKFHSDAEKYAEIKRLRTNASGLTAIDLRAIDRMELNFRQNQLPEDLQKSIFDKSSKIEMIFQNHRGKLNGKEYTNNDLLELLEKESDSNKRKKIWEALKQVGGEVDELVIELAKERNIAAQKLGFKNFWEMQVVFQDYEPEVLVGIFDELERLTTPLFAKVKGDLDAELAEKFGIAADKLMPWHYDNPFFQQAPPSKEVNPNDFYKNKKREELVDIALKYYRRVGLPYDKVLAKSDMYDRDGKNQHAFSIDMDTLGDVRNLCNVKPTDEWMDTILHEGGHGVYSLGIDKRLPFNLRTEAHIFTTEGIAMMFGAKARDPKWMVKFAGIDKKTANNAAKALQQQRIREQLIFCRWTLVMLHFEKTLYENPNADLKKLWWDTVEKYQLLKKPRGRKNGDWAAKPHFVIAPVYYHNYMLGELFAAQLRESLGKNIENDTPNLGIILKQKVFAPGSKYNWQDFVKKATGQPLSPKAFAKELEKY